MKVVLREDESGVSEVVGTILILAMTVVLFSTIIIWVSSIPTPVAQSRVDILGSLTPQYAGNGNPSGAYVNLTHQGGQSMDGGATVLYITDQKGTNASTTNVIHLAKYKTITVSPFQMSYGLLDGPGTGWSVGQRFSYFNSSFTANDKVSVTIVDLSRSIVLWTAQLTPPTGTRPPVFLNVWAARNNVGTPLSVQTGTQFYVFAQIMAPDNDLNASSVIGTLTYYIGVSGGQNCAVAKRMYDDGTSGNHGDAVAGDGTFTLFDNSCTGTASAGMDGSLVLLSASDTKGHTTTTRMVLHIVPGPTGGGTGNGSLSGSGRPPNLRWNGNQGYNLFNGSQWDTYGYAALPTRTFKGGDTVVVVVGSLSLQNVFGMDTFNLWDPYSGNPAESVVYGATKTVTSGTLPSSTSSFSFFQFVNGYYIYTFRFKLNDPSSVGTNFYTTPPQYPRYYYFANYPLSVLLTDSGGNRFTTTDSINITANNGALRTFPIVQTFSDAAFTQPSSSFRSTAVVFVQVKMLTVDTNQSGGMPNVFFGNVVIQDYAGGQELNRAPTNGVFSNLPVCPPFPNAVPCSSTNPAIWSSTGTTSYRFAINLARVNQDPWVAGTQNYALTVTSIKDSDESYADVSTQLVVQAPLYKMDMMIGNSPATNNAWGTKDYMYFFQDFNGFDIWKPLRVDYCSGLNTVSGVPGQGQGKCPQTNDVSVAFGDFWHDGSLGAAESIISSRNNSVVIYRHTVDATGAVVYLPVFFDFTPPTLCTAIAAADVTGNGLPSVICGGSNGWVWYYANNGNWTRVYVDQPSSGQQINSITVGDFNGDGWNDIAVGGAGGYLKYYPNLGYGRFQNSGISDNWFAGAEQTLKGNVTSGSLLSTYVQDGGYEQITEGPLNFPLQTGATVNPGFNTNAANWTFATAYNGASGIAQPTGGVSNGPYVQITSPFRASSTVAGYWYQPFTVSGSSPFTATLNLSYEITANTASNGVTMYAFVNATCGKPPQTPSTWAWTSGAITGTRGWTTVSVNAGQYITTAPMSAPTTYCLEVALYARYGTSGSGSSVGGFDNVALSWTSTAGAASALEQYWRIGSLPTRLGTAFTFNLYGHETGGSTAPEYDNFTFAYSTNVVGTDPTTGTYTTMFTVNRGSDSSYTFALPSSVAGMMVWVRALDTNRVVANTPSLDSLYVDRMWINANTPSGTTGVTLTADTSVINMVDAQDSNGDGFSDLVVGTTNGNVYKYMGGAGGLTSSGLWYAAGTSVVGVKWGNFSTAFPGLEIALAFGTTVRVIRGDAASSVIQSNLPVFSPSSTITAFAVGDINGDGWDDVAIGTTGGGVYLWENLGQGTAWTYAVNVYQLGAQVYSLVLGDSLNSLYMGR